ncbi:MAG TPA: ABC transporter permease [Oscillospiraceae bacterium]|nr:ABC transporter permease [Oscillospiraceae bacterium]
MAMLKVVKRPQASGAKQILYRLISVIIAILCSALIIGLMGYNPVEIFKKIIEGSTMTAYRLTETVKRAIPLTILSLGISIAFYMKFWNIGAEGQFFLGAFGAALIALNLPQLPAGVLIPLMFISGAFFGALWALIPCIFKVKLGASETLVTLMLNYVAIKLISYLQFGPWKDPKALGFARVEKFAGNAVLPKVFGVNAGWIIALVLMVFVYIIMRHTKLGYEIKVMGENTNTATYAGMNPVKITVIAVLLSGAICGMAGVVQASAVEKTISDQMSGGMGFTAVITTWLARLSAPAIVVVSLLFAMLLQGGAYIQSALQIPSSVAEVIQGIILFFVLSSEFFIEYRIVTKQGLEKLSQKV